MPRGKDIIIDDAYNSNPSGTKAALETLSYFDGFKILLTPGMVELGEKQAELNREFGKNAAKVCDYVILVGRSQTEPIAKGLAIGTASHGTGTARAIELGEVEGAMSGLSIAVAGLMTVVVAQVFALLH